MLYPLIVFGGMWFWIIIALDVLFMLAWLDDDDSGGGSAVAFGVSLGAFYALCEAPVLHWQWFAAYFVIGAVWFLAVFRYRIGKLKKFLTKKGHNKEKQSIHEFLSDYSGEGFNRAMLAIYNREPSYGRFWDRMFCWPLSMLKIIFADLLVDAWDYLVTALNRWKKSFLGEV